MSLARFFIVAASTALVIMLLSNAAYYFILADQSERFRRHMIQTAARAVAQNIHARLDQLIKTLEVIAQRSELAELLESGDAAQLKVEAERLRQHLPGILRLRVLKPDIDAPEQAQSPHMGYADLEMIHQAALSDPFPAVHSYGSEHEHLAIAHRIMVGEQVVGVILGSFSLSPLEEALASLGLPGAAVQLRQGPLSIGSWGDNNLMEERTSGNVPVSGTSWTVRYWPAPAHSRDRLMVVGVMSVSAGLLLLVSFFDYRRSVRIFRSDQEAIVQAVQDLFKGRKRGVYPLKIKDFDGTIRKLFQLTQQATQNVLDGVVKKTKEGDGAVSEPADFHLATSGIELKTEERLPDVPAEIFRAYDIRGRVGESLVSETIDIIGQAIGSEAHERGQQRVIIARDGRLSSGEFSEALARGLQKSGCDVIDLGMVPTPVLYFATHRLDSDTGVVITGSHNPREYNGLKIVMGGSALFGEELQKIHRRIKEGRLRKGNGTLEKMDLMSDYIDAIGDDIQISRPMKVVVDAGNGVAGILAPDVLQALGCDVVELYCDVAGRFPNHNTDPGQPENLKALIDAVKAEDADVGIAIDGDGDRLGVVDNEGKIIWPDRLLMLFAADVLSRHPGSDIVYDVECSRHLATEIVKHGGRPVMSKTGYPFIEARRKETNAMLGGEMTGHIFFKDRWFGFDDALYASARLIEILSLDPRSGHAVFAAVPDSINTPELRILLEEGEPDTLMKAFMKALNDRANFANVKVTDIDGVRVDFSDGWGLVRASNTMPDLVLRFEADNEEALARVQQQFKTLLKSIKPEIECPF
jgi:phosphomannomutase / phosphoglucomutase